MRNFNFRLLVAVAVVIFVSRTTSIYADGTIDSISVMNVSVSNEDSANDDICTDDSVSITAVTRGTDSVISCTWYQRVTGSGADGWSDGAVNNAGIGGLTNCIGSIDIKVDVVFEDFYFNQHTETAQTTYVINPPDGIILSGDSPFGTSYPIGAGAAMYTTWQVTFLGRNVNIMSATAVSEKIIRSVYNGGDTTTNFIWISGAAAPGLTYDGLTISDGRGVNPVAPATDLSGFGATATLDEFNQTYALTIFIVGTTTSARCELQPTLHLQMKKVDNTHWQLLDLTTWP